MRCSLRQGLHSTISLAFVGEEVNGCSRLFFRARETRSSSCRDLKKDGCARSFTSLQKCGCGRRMKARRKLRRRHWAIEGFERGVLEWKRRQHLRFSIICTERHRDSNASPLIL